MPLGFEKQLVNYVIEFHRSESEPLSPGYGKTELLNILRTRAEKNAVIMAENNRLIDEKLKPLLNDPENISDDDAASLFALARRLYSLNESLDMGLALEIHTGLLNRAKIKNDINLIIKQLYWTGIIYQQFSMSLFANEARGFFSEAAAYKAQYFSISDKETRMYFNRCLGNVYMATSAARHREHDNIRPIIKQFLEKLDDAVSFWSGSGVRALDPDFPWDGFMNNAHQNVCGWLDALRRPGIAQREPDLVRRVYESITVLTEKAALLPKNRFWPESRTRYSWLASRYYMGEISFDETIEGLKEMLSKVGDDDYTDEGIYCNLLLSGVILDLLAVSEQKYKEKYKNDRDALLDRVFKYCERMQRRGSKYQFNEVRGYLFMSLLRKTNSDVYLNLMLKFTAFSHLPTYTHSVQVKNIVEILARHFMRHKPEMFIGLLGTKDVADVLSRQGEILPLASKAGLCHDLGKVSYANTVAITSRRLRDYEFKIIQGHVTTIKLPDTSNETISCVNDVIQGHHKWYDGSGGYPAEFDNRASKYVFIIDLVSVADSIDAATDGMGRSYAKVLTSAQVIEEIQQQAGTRYSPIVAEALKNPAVVDEIRECITEGRKTAYYEAYLDMCGGEQQEPV